MKVLRWIAVFPAALLGAAAVYLGLVLVHLVLTATGDIGSTNWVRFVGSIATGFAFVFMGSKTAPSHRKGVAVALAVLFSASSIGVAALAMAGNYSDPLWFVLACLTAGVLASGVAAFRFWHGFA